jgi:hypothetical protein
VRDNERAAREKSWYALKSQGLLNWDELSPVTAQILDDRMRSGPTPDIIHYYGHGSYQDGQGYLVFDGAPESGQHELVSAQRLAALLGGIRLIVIHACQSAMVQHNQSQSGLLTGLAPALSAVSEAVVAMQLTVRISAATRFAEVFYAELARGRSLQKAVADARRSLYVIESDGASWYVPTLYIRTREQKPLYFVHTHTTIIERERRLDHPIPQPDHVPPHQEPNRDTQGILDTPVTGNQGGMIEEAESPDPSLFAELQELLMNKNWQAADEETGRIFLSIAKRQKKGWLRKNDIEQIPCTVIRAIDKLWADYSDRRFGFHTQKRIWQTVAEHRERFAIGDFIHFGDRVGWRAADKWLQTYDQFLFTVDAPEGHLPSLRMLVSSDDMHSWTIWKNTFEGLLSRIKQCL